MAPLVDGWDYGSWSAVYNALSFGPKRIWSQAFSILISACLNFSTGHFSVPLRCPLCCSHLQSEFPLLISDFATDRYRGDGECDDLLLVPLRSLAFVLARTGFTQ